MQLEVVYFRFRGFLKYLFLGRTTGTAIWLKSSNSFFCRYGKSFNLLKAHIFMKNFEIVDMHTLPVDYDIYVKVAQLCMKKVGTEPESFSIKEITGVKQTYETLIDNLKADQDYTHIKRLTSKEIDELTPKKLHSYFSSVLSDVNL